jgi:hypothetical protein
MELDFDRASIELKDGGVWLCLRVKSSFNARRFVFSMRDKLYTADLKEKRKKRSLSANAYFWTLCGKLASTLGIPSHEIYRIPGFYVRCYFPPGGTGNGRGKPISLNALTCPGMGRQTPRGG